MRAISCSGTAKAHLRIRGIEQRQHGHTGQHGLTGLPRPLADDPVERSQQPAIIKILTCQFAGRLGLPQAGADLDPLDFGKALCVMKLFHTGISVLRLIERSPGRLVGLTGRRGIEFGQQIALADPAPLVRMNGSKGPAERETQSYGASGRHGPDIDGGHRINGGFRHDRSHAQGFDRPQRLPRGAGCRKKQHCQKGHSFHLHRVFGCKIVVLPPIETALNVGSIRQKVRF